MLRSYTDHREQTHCKSQQSIIEDSLAQVKRRPLEVHLRIHQNRQVNKFLSRLSKTLSNAQSCYNEAIQIADKEGIPKTSPVRLGVVLNLSVLLYEIGNDSKKAIEICEKGFNEASNLLNDIEMDEYKDTTTIMQVMYDNLTNWKNEEEK